MPFIISRVSATAWVGLLALAACRANAQEGVKPLPPAQTLTTANLAGQTIPVLPLTLLVADPSLQTDTLFARYQDRRAGLLHADSLLGEELERRAPEVRWVLPPQLRKVARRSAGFVEDPDQMGQAVLRSPMEKAPDPLRSSLRGLVALVDGRFALVPASVGFGPEPDRQIRADLTLVVVDGRTGKILWRSLAYGRGATPDQALNAALAAVLPVSSGGP
jgi:hypothetical protein